ncbi:MAG: biofilm-associated protein [Nitrosopumilaceae archaeon]|nr:biofilm-associated protein [Nitrosopumilaceae archaeon]NIT99465.1 biofilm-associated protein [Nitrosopumilaceae archaeon]NIU85824.1 biofilm-associated protein [Nitrosopumilaceae archaeon]NIV64681.1 biofilm-associated protein [Nitrosopumilaceae archaeon]NIX60068.1 biofilm-associated protein [Nitrosopumilaceae archaeon]
MKTLSFNRLFLILLISASFSLGIFFSDSFAQTELIDAKSTAFEKTTILEFTNEGNTEIAMFRIWLGSDIDFKSFKTEEGWVGKKTPQGVIVFTSSETIRPGESIKFGVKTDKTKPGINWKALDKDDNQLKIGKVLPTDLSEQAPEPPKSESEGGILSSSVFRLIPEKPNVGSTIRVIGNNFGPTEELEFFIDKQKLETFETDENGKFVITTKIPSTVSADRVDFIIKDSTGNQKDVSLRLGEGEEVLKAEDIKLTTREIPSSVYRGEDIKITGTAPLGSTVTINIKDQNDKIVTTNVVEANQRGEWSYTKTVGMDLDLGKYVLEIISKKDKITKTLEIETSKNIQVSPIRIKFTPGDTIKFNGTGIPNQQIELILEDPQGNEVSSNVLDLDESGKFEFEYPTIVSTTEGTYALFAIQGNEETVALAGLGQLPAEHMTIRMNKLNYDSNENATMRIHGPASSTLNLIITDPSNKEKETDVIQLGPQGWSDYELSLSGYSSGAYSAVVTRGGSQASETFTVGLQTGSGDIKIRTTKEEYKPSDPILVLGTSNKNVLLTLMLIDPDGEQIQQRETFTNKEGILSEDNFRVPTNAKPGTWTVRAESGANYATTEFSVNPSQEEGVTVWIADTSHSDGNTFFTFQGVNAEGRTIVLTIISPQEEVVDELSFPSKENGDFRVVWMVPPETPSGTYKVMVEDAQKNTAEDTFEIS